MYIATTVRVQTSLTAKVGIHVSLGNIPGAFITRHELQNRLFVIVRGKYTLQPRFGAVQQERIDRRVTSFGAFLRLGRRPLLCRFVIFWGH
jgi:hypothetical protein